MHVAVRSRLNVGIALAGAGAIALAPIAQPMPAIAELQARAVSSAQVALTAAANPIEQWAQIIEDTLANGGALEHTQEMAAHESPRTTKLDDHTKERCTQDEVERIRL